MSIDKALFRLVAGSFASGVTVVTTGRDGHYHGMTASAFASLSIDPTMILVCVDRAARTFPLLQQTGAFNINILSTRQENYSRLFASKDAPEHGLSGIDFTLSASGVPLLTETLGFLECKTTQEFDGGDHVIFVGEVENAGFREDLEPLLYYRGKYRHFEALEAETSPGTAPRSDLA
jgi:flavin reductase (DIM6/NTAB) family NADH-FMN oxidoreductase RutF